MALQTEQKTGTLALVYLKNGPLCTCLPHTNWSPVHLFTTQTGPYALVYHILKLGPLDFNVLYIRV